MRVSSSIRIIVTIFVNLVLKFKCPPRYGERKTKISLLIHGQSIKDRHTVIQDKALELGIKKFHNVIKNMYRSKYLTFEYVFYCSIGTNAG
jgi:hypothetical protein